MYRVAKNSTSLQQQPPCEKFHTLHCAALFIISRVLTPSEHENPISLNSPTLLHAHESRMHFIFAIIDFTYSFITCAWAPLCFICHYRAFIVRATLVYCISSMNVRNSAARSVRGPDTSRPLNMAPNRKRRRVVAIPKNTTTYRNLSVLNLVFRGDFWDEFKGISELLSEIVDCFITTGLTGRLNNKTTVSFFGRCCSSWPR
jgi:hypothetical protein